MNNCEEKYNKLVIHNFVKQLPASLTPLTIYFVKTPQNTMLMYVTDSESRPYLVGRDGGDVTLTSPNGTISINGYNIDIAPGILNFLLNENQYNYLTSLADNRLVQVGNIEINDFDITLEDVIWIINGVTRTVPTDTFIITPATDGYYRNDIIVGNASGQLVLIGGIESQTNPAEPVIPPNTILITRINIFGNSVIVPPTTEIPTLQQVLEAGSVGVVDKNIAIVSADFGNNEILGVEFIVSESLNIYKQTENGSTGFELNFGEAGIKVVDNEDEVGLIGSAYYGDNATDNTYIQKKFVTDNTAKTFILSNEDLADASRKDDVLYGILDRYTGEEVTLYKVTGTPTVDSIIIFQLGSEYFRRVVTYGYNVKWFGAVGDGITDDLLPIRATMEYMDSITGGTVFFPKGSYLTSDRLDTTAPYTTFTGDGAKLIYKANKVGIVLMHDYCTVKNMSFEGENATATSGVNSGLFIQGASFATVNNCHFKFNGHGVCVFSGNSYKGEIYSENSPTGNVIDNNIFESKGVYGSLENFSGVLMGFSVEKPVIANKVTNNYVYGNFVVDHGIALIGAGYDNIIEGNTVYNCRSYGILLYQTEFLTDYSVHHNKIDNNRIDGVGNAGTLKGMGIYTQKAHYTTISNNTVSNAEIGAGIEGALAQSGISVDGGTYNDISNNSVSNIQASKPAIRVNNSFFTNVVGNNYENDYVGISITESSDVNVVGNIGKNNSMASLLIVGGLTQSTLSPPYNSIPSGLNINIIGNSFINTAADANVIDVSGVSTYFVDGINIQNNTIDMLGNAMNVVTTKNGLISGNTIISNLATGKSGIILNNVTDNIQVANNRIYSKSGSYTYGVYSDGTTNRVLTNYITNATTPISNSGSNLTVSDTALIYNKDINVGGIVDSSFFSITTPGANRADFAAKGDALTFSTIDGTGARIVFDTPYWYYQIGSTNSRVRLTAASGTVMQTLNVDSDDTMFSGTVSGDNAINLDDFVTLQQLNASKKISTTATTSTTVIVDPTTATSYRLNAGVTTVTLPTLTGNAGTILFFVNNTGINVTLNSNAGGNDIWSGGASVNTESILAGSVMRILHDGTQWAIL